MGFHLSHDRREASFVWCAILVAYIFFDRDHDFAEEKGVDRFA
jgi:hypothetical protein